jgi:hypothetical protein
LEQTIGEATGGSAEVNCYQAGDIEPEMIQCVFEFVAAAADEFFTGIQRERIFRFDGVARLVGELIVDADLACEDKAFSAFAAVAKAAFDQRLIEASHEK